MRPLKKQFQRVGCFVALLVLAFSFLLGSGLLQPKVADAAPPGANGNTARNLLEFYNYDDPSAANVGELRINAYSGCGTSIPVPSQDDCDQTKSSCTLAATIELTGCGNLKLNVDETNKLADASNGKDLVWSSTDPNSKYQVVFDMCQLRVGDDAALHGLIYTGRETRWNEMRSLHIRDSNHLKFFPTYYKRIAAIGSLSDKVRSQIQKFDNHSVTTGDDRTWTLAYENGLGAVSHATASAGCPPEQEAIAPMDFRRIEVKYLQFDKGAYDSLAADKKPMKLFVALVDDNDPNKNNKGIISIFGINLDDFFKTHSDGRFDMSEFTNTTSAYVQEHHHYSLYITAGSKDVNDVKTNSLLSGPIRSSFVDLIDGNTGDTLALPANICSSDCNVGLDQYNAMLASGKDLKSLDINGVNSKVPTPPTPTGGTSSTAHVDCEWSFNPLTWVMCPLLDGLQGIVNSIGDFLKDQLNVDADFYFNRQSDNGRVLYAAWNSIRLVAMAMLVVIALIMVMAQALSIDVIDAYTVKKVLPRLAIAIIAISLSWEITRLLVIFSNDLAKAVQSIIIVPFSAGGQGLSNPTLNATQVIAIGVGGVAVGIPFLLTIFAAAALALFIAFVAIILRQMAIIFLVIVSPIAILASILPNTQKAWKIWHETFNGALLVYAIIVGFIALGAVFGKIANQVPNPSAPFIALIATYIPYFLIPKAFSMASGLIGTLGGMVNDRSKGLFDSLRKRRGEIMKDRYARAKNEKLWNPNNPMIKKLSGSKYKAVRALNPNKLATWTAAPHKNLAYATRNQRIPFLSASGRQLAASIEHEAFEQTQKLGQQINTALGGNDKAARTMGGLHDGLLQSTQAKLREAGLVNEDGSGKALTSERDILKAADILSTSSSHTEKVAATALRRSAAVIGGMYRDVDMNYASVAGANGLVLGAHGFANRKDLPQIGRNILRETGSAEFADAELVQVELAVANSMPHLKAGYGHLYDPNTGEFLDAVEAGRDLDVIETMAPGHMAGAKGGAIKDQQDTFKYIIDNVDYDQDKEQQIKLEESKIEKERQVTANLRKYLSKEQVEAELQQNPRVQAARAEIQRLQAPSQGEQAYMQLEDKKREVAAAHPELNPDQVNELVKYDPALKDTNRLAQAWRMGDAFKQQILFSGASRFSQAPVDNKRRLMEIINSKPELKAEFERFERGAASGDAEIMAMIQANNTGVQQAQQAQQAQAAQLAAGRFGAGGPPIPGAGPNMGAGPLG